MNGSPQAGAGRVSPQPEWGSAWRNAGTGQAARPAAASGVAGTGCLTAAPGQAALGVSERRTVAGAAGSQGGRRRVVSVGGRRGGFRGL